MRPDVRIRRSFPALPRLAALASVVALVSAGSACTSSQMAGQSSSYLIIDTIKAASGANPNELSNTLQSDVETKGGVIEDGGEVSLSLGLKDPGSADSPSAPSTTNFVTVNRYRVEFVRADHRNVQGVDVPYAFDGAFTATVSDNGAVATFVLVREQAKLEAPLLALRGGGGAIGISTIAQVTFYGHDQAGREMSATGQISVNFADWVDPQ
jgi:hypothetical protein